MYIMNLPLHRCEPIIRQPGQQPTTNALGPLSILPFSFFFFFFTFLIFFSFERLSAGILSGQWGAFYPLPLLCITLSHQIVWFPPFLCHLIHCPVYSFLSSLSSINTSWLMNHSAHLYFFLSPRLLFSTCEGELEFPFH